jgi:hypothetical protein
MHPRNRTIVHVLDTKERPSTGITRLPLPLIPVDGDTSKLNRDATRGAPLRGNNAEGLAEHPLTSLELLRQLETFVRDLFEISTSE